jgi:hypothetical protein
MSIGDAHLGTAKALAHLRAGTALGHRPERIGLAVRDELTKEQLEAMSQQFRARKAQVSPNTHTHMTGRSGK